MERELADVIARPFLIILEYHHNGEKFPKTGGKRLSFLREARRITGLRNYKPITSVPGKVMQSRNCLV